jgi:hypothetical protein
VTDSDSASSAPSKPKHGGVGNLNKVANDPKGLALAFWRRGALSPGSRWVAQRVKQYIRNRTAELGTVSEGQRALIETSAIAQGVLWLICAEVAKRGEMVRDGEGGLDIVPALKELPKFIGKIHSAEVALGLVPSKPEAIDAYALIGRVEAGRVRRSHNQP